MNRREFALMALAGAKRQSFSPVQLQKLLFLLDRNIGERVGGSGFNFQPYHYGPFDQSVYSTLEQLAHEGLAEIQNPEEGAWRRYRLTETGQGEGEKIWRDLDPRAVDYIGSICTFVRSQSFAGLVSSIYRTYPDMKVNSVFQE